MAGHPVRYIKGHQNRGIVGKASHSWKGGKSFVSSLGYVVLTGQRGHPHAYGKGKDRVLEHVDIAYRALGKSLPPGAEVHHVNGVRSDNRPSNLVICQDHSYHFLIEKRTRAYAATGDANALYCALCKQWDVDASDIHVGPSGTAVHRACGAARARKQRAKV